MNIKKENKPGRKQKTGCERCFVILLALFAASVVYGNETEMYEFRSADCIASAMLV